MRAVTQPNFEDCPAKPRVECLEEWQVRQNGSLERIEKKVDKLLFWLLASIGGLTVVLIGLIATLLGIT